MQRSRFSDEQIIRILSLGRALCRKHGVSDFSIYKEIRWHGRV